jgi:hypothetical protein
MTHYCTTCLSEFDDDSGPLPDADCVHCVFCGARIALTSRRRPPASVVPFSKDYEREEAFALGVINGNGPGFPDTLREFRVRSSQRGLDSLTPLAQGSEPPSAGAPTPRAPRRLASLSASLSVGFAIGVAIAFAAVSLRPEPKAPSAAASTRAPRSGTAESTVAGPKPVEPPATRPAAPGGPAAAPAPAKGAQPLSNSPSRPASTPAQDRRWLVDRARAEQRLYRLAAAERLYRQALLISPRDSEALSGLGELELLRGTLDLAEARFQDALRANANYIPALIAAADLRWQSGRAEEARQQYQDIVDHYDSDSYPPYVILRSARTSQSAASDNGQPPLPPECVPSRQPQPPAF